MHLTVDLGEAMKQTVALFQTVAVQVVHVQEMGHRLAYGQSGAYQEARQRPALEVASSSVPFAVRYCFTAAGGGNERLDS